MKNIFSTYLGWLILPWLRSFNNFPRSDNESRRQRILLLSSIFFNVTFLRFPTYLTGTYEVLISKISLFVSTADQAVRNELQTIQDIHFKGIFPMYYFNSHKMSYQGSHYHCSQSLLVWNLDLKTIFIYLKKQVCFDNHSHSPCIRKKWELDASP